MSESEVLLRESRGAVVQITLNRPHAMNALNSKLRAALTAFWREFRDSSQWRVAIVTGAGGRAFSRGRDFKETDAADEAGDRLGYERAGEQGCPDNLKSKES